MKAKTLVKMTMVLFATWFSCGAAIQVWLREPCHSRYGVQA